MTSDDHHTGRAHPGCGHAIEAEEVRRRYDGGFEAVSGVTFAVPHGEVFALLGTNGAGKTSTVELLEGSLPSAAAASASSATTRTGNAPPSGRASA